MSAHDSLPEDTILGQKVTEKTRRLDVFDLPPSTDEVDYVTDEVTSNCPITGQPDFYHVEVRLRSTAKGIESKSLKLYLQSFSDEGQFCEAFADTICRDAIEATQARYVTVYVVQKPRGGISIRATSTLMATGGEE